MAGRGGVYSARTAIKDSHNAREDLYPIGNGNPPLRGMGSPRLFQAGAEAQGQALHHRHPAAQCDGLAAHGACAQQHHPGHPLPLRADARPRRAVAAGHRPCGHRHADGGGAPADEGKQDRPPQDGARGLSQARVAVEGGIGRDHFAAAAPPWCFLRLVARALHHGRRACPMPCARCSSSSTRKS